MRRALSLVCLAACSSTQVRVETVEGERGPRPTSYALLDFVNRTDDPRAADSVRGSLLHVIEASGGKVVDATAARQLDPERLDRDVARPSPAVARHDVDGIVEVDGLRPAIHRPDVSPQAAQESEVLHEHPARVGVERVIGVGG